MDMNNKFREYRQTKDPALREQLIMANKGLVHKAVNEFFFVVTWGIMERGDLESAGMEGLIQAVDGFDPDRGNRFSTYAVPRIEGAIKNEIACYRGKVPRTLEAKVQKVKRALEEFKKEMGCEPTEQEIAERLQMTVEEIREVWRLVSILFPEPVDGSGDIPKGIDTLKAELRDAIIQLPKQQRKIAELYMESYTFDGIAEKLGKSPGTIRTIWFQQIIPALKKLVQ